MKPYFASMLLLLSLVFFSCEKTITVTPPVYNTKVSIQSMLEPDSLPIVYFNRTVPYFSSQVNLADLVIRNASIQISNGSLIDVLKLDSVYDKIYCEYNFYYKGSVPIQLNQNYSLTITDGNNSYTATTSTVGLTKAIIDSITYTSAYNDFYGEHEGVITYFEDVGSHPNYYRYQMDRYVDTATKKAETKIASRCLGSDSVAVQELGRSVYSNTGQEGQQIKIVIEPAYSHKAGTKGIIYIQTIDKNAFDFFDQLDQQKLAQFNPFVEPVFLREGQFGSKAIGYFSAMRKSNPSLYQYPE